MSVWHWIALASAVAFLTKFLGFAIPARYLLNSRMAHIAACMTIALLAALTVMNTFASGQTLTVDARLAAFAVSAIALMWQLPFLLVVLLGAAAAALLRWV